MCVRNGESDLCSGLIEQRFTLELQVSRIIPCLLGQFDRLTPARDHPFRVRGQPVIKTLARRQQLDFARKRGSPWDHVPGGARCVCRFAPAHSVMFCEQSYLRLLTVDFQNSASWGGWLGCVDLGTIHAVLSPNTRLLNTPGAAPAAEIKVPPAEKIQSHQKSFFFFFFLKPEMDKM